MNLTILRKAFLITFGVYMLIGMHYLQHNLGGSGIHLPFNAIGWIFISILMGIGWWQAKLQAELVYSRLSLMFVMATLVMLIPLLYADPIVVGLSYGRLLGLIGGLLFFIALQQLQLNQQQRLMLLYLILGAVFVEATFSLVQYYGLPVNNTFGYDKIANRPYGIFQQPNVAASFLATGIALTLYLLTQTKLNENNNLHSSYSPRITAISNRLLVITDCPANATPLGLLAITRIKAITKPIYLVSMLHFRYCYWGLYIRKCRKSRSLRGCSNKPRRTGTDLFTQFKYVVRKTIFRLGLWQF